MTAKRPWFAVVDLQRCHTSPKTRTSWQSRSDLIDETSTMRESQFNLEVCLAGSRGCAVPATRELATTVQADVADVVEFDLTRCDSDLEAVSERAQHEQNVHGGESNTNRVCPDVTQEQGAGRDRQKRRLILTSSQVVPDSHDRRFRRVRQAMQCERREDCWLNVWGPCRRHSDGYPAPPMVGAQRASSVGSS